MELVNILDNTLAVIPLKSFDWFKFYGFGYDIYSEDYKIVVTISYCCKFSVDICGEDNKIVETLWLFSKCAK